jgi:hypothetical protein
VDPFVALVGAKIADGGVDNLVGDPGGCGQITSLLFRILAHGSILSYQREGTLNLKRTAVVETERA